MAYLPSERQVYKDVLADFEHEMLRSDRTEESITKAYDISATRLQTIKNKAVEAALKENGVTPDAKRRQKRWFLRARSQA